MPPKPKYKSGAAFYKWRLLDPNGTKPELIDDNTKVRCLIISKLWYDHKNNEWIYSGIAQQAVMIIDNNWGTDFSDYVSIGEKELDSQKQSGAV